MARAKVPGIASGATSLTGKANAGYSKKGGVGGVNALAKSFGIGEALIPKPAKLARAYNAPSGGGGGGLGLGSSFAKPPGTIGGVSPVSSTPNPNPKMGRMKSDISPGMRQLTKKKGMIAESNMAGPTTPRAPKKIKLPSL